MVLHDLLLDVSRHLAGKESGMVEKTSRSVEYSYMSNCYINEESAVSRVVAQSSSSPNRKEVRSFRDRLLAI